MAETFDTPFGGIKKQTAYILAGIAGIVLLVVWYRGKSSSTPDVGTPTEVNPATGYVYGSAEDASVLEQQAEWKYPSIPSSGGLSSGGFINNAQWSQFVVQYMQTQQIVMDAGPLTAALGRYLTGQPLTAEQLSLVQQAVAVGGYPPVSGLNGYPPSYQTISSTPPATPPTNQTVRREFTVEPRWLVNNWIRDVQRHPEGNPAFTYNLLVSLNPGVHANIDWQSARNGGFTEYNRFINMATYRVR